MYKQHDPSGVAQWTAECWVQVKIYHTRNSSCRDVPVARLKFAQTGMSVLLNYFWGLYSPLLSGEGLGLRLYESKTRWGVRCIFHIGVRWNMKPPQIRLTPDFSPLVLSRQSGNSKITPDFLGGELLKNQHKQVLKGNWKWCQIFIWHEPGEYPAPQQKNLPEYRVQGDFNF